MLINFVVFSEIRSFLPPHTCLQDLSEFVELIEQFERWESNEFVLGFIFFEYVIIYSERNPVMVLSRNLVREDDIQIVHESPIQIIADIIHIICVCVRHVCHLTESWEEVGLHVLVNTVMHLLN